MKDFFGFRTMVSTSVIKFIYIMGMIALTISGIVMLFQGDEERILIGVGTIIFGNLFWRVICEGGILLFSIHEILITVERNLSQK
ncbi:MAG: hypothetical protein DDT42_01658 [candidate division WS2 bacterium]|uniref:DUF4282 domain-containing protein n=1 Tax=Psychracetigena formicireducens TaxID=2986056 RepID=A0A9E2F534_PSYF1|nr:hypothetical protein [Candidatus Psychracetigena formicireducens]MBT9145781.1 hypothetical protein [Candidatus Psychracetigena formicireducens]